MEQIDESEYLYYEAYNDGTDAWTSGNAQSAITTANDGDAHGNYMNFASGTDSGNRGAYSAIDCKVSENYSVEVDVKLTPGNVANRSLSQFAITTTGTDAKAGNNNGVTSGYLVKLSAGPSSETYTINDSDQTVTIPSNTWVTVKAVVTTGNNVALMITNQSTGEVLYTGTVTANGSTEFAGLYLLRGRGAGTASVDTVRIKND